MAIKSSGQLSLRYDVAREISPGLSSNISIAKQAQLAGLTDPDRMSDFYGYSAIPNLRFWNTRRGSISNSNGGNTAISSDRIAVSGWFSPRNIRKKNLMFWSTGQNKSTKWMLRGWYYASLNRMVIHVYDKNGVRRMRREYPLHDNPNRDITGIINFRTGWCRSQRGNSDPNFFVHLGFIVDLESQSYTGLKTYWNGQELPYSVNNQSTSINISDPGQSWKTRLWDLHIGHSINNQSYGASNNMEGGMDNIWLYSGSATASELTTAIQGIYAKGNDYQYSVAPLGLTPFASQGFEGSLTFQGYLDSGKGIWQINGSTYNYQYY